MASKTCSRCQLLKEEEFFSKAKKGKLKRLSVCNLCRSEQRRDRKLRDPEKYRLQDKKRKRVYVLKQYGLTVEDYAQLLDKQQGKCAICKSSSCPSGSSLAVDHDHVTGRVRGLLCYTCNIGLGRYEAFKERAEKYLRG